MDLSFGRNLFETNAMFLLLWVLKYSVSGLKLVRVGDDALLGIKLYLFSQ